MRSCCAPLVQEALRFLVQAGADTNTADRDGRTILHGAAERLALLQGQHRLLDQKIIDLQTRPWQNQLLVQRLKKEKLRLKEAIERLKDEIIPDLNA